MWKMHHRITERELIGALKIMSNDKSPGNDGLSKEFCEMFWSEVKKPFLSCILHLTKTSNYKIKKKKDKYKILV